MTLYPCSNSIKKKINGGAPDKDKLIEEQKLK
jgi:hypothetical protein